MNLEPGYAKLPVRDAGELRHEIKRSYNGELPLTIEKAEGAIRYGRYDYPFVLSVSHPQRGRYVIFTDGAAAGIDKGHNAELHFSRPQALAEFLTDGIVRSRYH